MDVRMEPAGFAVMPSAWLRWCCAMALIAAGAWLAGCATTPEVTAITLSGVVRAEQTVLTGRVPGDAMHLVRNGAAYHVVPDMVIETGDTLSTGPDTAFVLSYPGGARAYVYPNSRVRIGSIFDDIGKVFVKVKGAFTVKTQFVTAGSEGTQYWVNVRERDEVKVVVVEDVVSLSSNTGAWMKRPLRANEQAVCRGPLPAVISAADPAEIQHETDWVRNMDRLVPVRTAVNPWAVLGVGAAILIPLILMNEGDHDRPSRPAGTTHPNQ